MNNSIVNLLLYIWALPASAANKTVLYFFFAKQDKDSGYLLKFIRIDLCMFTAMQKSVTD